MTEGTISYLVGCHQFAMHPLQVIRAWRAEYGTWPKWWQTISIICHDIGVCGRQYLSDDNAKIGHWKLGARMACRIVRAVARLRKDKYLANFYAKLAWYTCAGHCPEESGFPESRLSRADKRSWLVAPMWWMWSNYYVEWHGRNIGVTPPPEWRRLVAENLQRERPLGNHQLYLRNRKAYRCA